MTLTTAQFRALLDLWMVSDPWPLDEWQHDELGRFITEASKSLGFEDWVEAYHRLSRDA